MNAVDIVPVVGRHELGLISVVDDVVLVAVGYEVLGGIDVLIFAVDVAVARCKEARILHADAYPCT